MKDDLNDFIPEPERREIESLYRACCSVSHGHTSPIIPPSDLRRVSSPFLCRRLSLHRWSKWWVVKKNEIQAQVQTPGGTTVMYHVGQFVEQKRFCVRCYKVDLAVRKLVI